ncbi:hypothetical protein OESDEN_10957 [Oesophagostomum dentatum]|uniref:TIL domain-containing protein n=1 Tax=Oesophagostomum dentatum TaxID=61180 RepID=A0A0B1SW88_OESDE|nr:hypothetical protein OESDEN_10957 [Oesophagostomum dentatum]
MHLKTNPTQQYKKSSFVAKENLAERTRNVRNVELRASHHAITPILSVCTLQCVLNVCQCKQGYIRDDATNKCILYADCPKDRVIPCSEMNCPEGTRCKLGRVICPFVPPCFVMQTVCVPSKFLFLTTAFYGLYDRTMVAQV